VKAPVIDIRRDAAAGADTGGRRSAAAAGRTADTPSIDSAARVRPTKARSGGAASAARAAAMVAAVRQPDLLRALEDLGETLACTKGPRELARETVAQLRDILDAADCDIWLGEGESLRLIASCDRDGFDEACDGQTYPMDSFLAARHVMERGRPLSLTLTEPDAQYVGPGERGDMERYGYQSLLTVPLRAGERVIGGLDIYQEEPDGLTAGYSDFVMMAARLVGASFEKTLLVERLEHANRELGLANSELAHANGELEVLNRHPAQAYKELGFANAELTRSNGDLRGLVEAGLEFGATLDLDEVLVASARRMCRVSGAARCDVLSLVGDELRSLVCIDGDTIMSEAACETWPIEDTVVCREAIEQAEPRWVVDAGTDDRLSASERAYFARNGQRSAMLMPLVAGGQVIGLTLLTDERPREMQSQGLLRGLAQLAARALANAALHREAQLLNRIARRVMSSLSVSDIAGACVEELSSLVPFECAALALRGPNGFTFPFLWGLDEVENAQDVASLLAPGLGETLAREQVLRVSLREQSLFTADHPWLEGLSSVALIGVEASGELVGALALGSRRASAFNWVDIGLLFRTGVQLSLAVNNALLFERVRAMHLANLKALSSALNAKDPYTLGHAVRVAAYVALLGQELGWSAYEVARAQEVVYLHDIGKLAVSDRVLLKPTGLTAPEWGLMRRHSVFSAEIIHALFEPRLVDGVRHHHERWDGSGYPDGLTGDDIPEVARALAVADAYDAMSSKRPYRDALSYDECVCELKRCRGTQFEPRMVDGFLAVLERMHLRRGRAGQVAEIAALRIDAAAHERLRRPGDEAREEYERVARVLRAVRRENPPTHFLHTARLDDGILRIVVDAPEDADELSRLGESLPLGDEVAQVLAGGQPATNVVTVNEWGAWVSASVAVNGPDGAPLFLVTADLPPSDTVDLEGLHGDMTHTLAALVHTAATRLSREGIEAITDTLTGLYNRRYLDERLEQEVVRCREQGGQLSLLFGDLDNFKAFNDRAGHQAGDDVLGETAEAIAGALRHQDVAARFGGEEFVVVLVDTGRAAARRVAERIRQSVAALRTEERPTPTISIGLATFPRDAASVAELVGRADEAMYRVKHDGGNGVCGW
jgi:diguanylate cyclase (GGDEF)-like protein